MTQTEAKKHKTGEKLMLVRYGKMGLLGWFWHNETNIPKINPRVIIHTDRGLETGKLIGLYSYKSGNFRWTCEKVSEYYEEVEYGKVVNSDGNFVRFATAEDISEEKHLEASIKREIELCEQIVKEYNLEMAIVDAEHIFGGERIVFYFMSESRIDFRELVKRLAREFQTRIEMRQIGARDETKLISDIETCGQQCCCARYLKILKPVNMRMAKVQKATLDPSKISGYCGRLKCCLRYEDETYTEFKQQMPKIGTYVKTSHGSGEIVDHHIITQLVVIKGEDGKTFAVRFDETEPAIRPPQKPQQKTDDNIKERERPFVKKQVNTSAKAAPAVNVEGDLDADGGQDENENDIESQGGENISPNQQQDGERRKKRRRKRRKKNYDGSNPQQAMPQQNNQQPDNPQPDGN